MSSILIVDDDNQLRNSFQKLLQEEGYETRTASSGEDGIKEVEAESPDMMIMDVRLPGMNGLEAFREIRKLDTRLPVIIMTAFGTTETAIEATKLGAFDYILKPFEIPDILKLIGQALEAGRMMKRRVEMNGSAGRVEESEAIVGSSEQMQEVYKSIGRAAPTDATVLIRGESGTGKELVARALYQHSARKNRPFLVINCVAIPETLLESELFGYEKGAFTGAVNRRVGKIEQASGGTVFLDEIGDMPVSIQAKILRLLQEKSIERLGGGQQIPVDVRIIAATNRNLEECIANGDFREDLYYRLKVVTVELPPLRERKRDIPALCDYFMARFSAEMNIDNPGISDDAREIIRANNWPGNVRELENALKKALIFSRGYPLRPEDISQAINEGTQTVDAEYSGDFSDAARQWARAFLASGEHPDSFNYLIDRFGEILVGEALSLTGGNRSKAAKMLGLSRPTLQAKIEKYNVSIETSVKEK